MIVKCIENTGKKLPEQLFSYHGWSKEMEFVKVTIGKEYIVYAIKHIDNHPFYMICGDDYDGQYVDYPELKPSVLFEIIDDTLSKFWTTDTKNNLKDDSGAKKDVGFKEMLENEYFYGNLLEGYEEEVKIFSSIKRKIDKENSL